MINIKLIDHPTALREKVYENGIKIGFVEPRNEGFEARTYFTHKRENFKTKKQAINWLKENKYTSENAVIISFNVEDHLPTDIKLEGAPEIQELFDNASGEMKKDIIYRIHKNIQEKYFNTQDSYKLSKEELMSNIYKDELDKIRKKMKIEKVKAERKAKAKETGEEQFYYSYSEDCNDPEAECDVDLINVYIDSEGNTREERIHAH